MRFGLRFVENERRGRRKPARHVECALDIAFTERGVERSAAQISGVVVPGSDRFVDDIPVRDAVAVSRHDGFDVRLKQLAAIGGRCLFDPVGKRVIPDQRMAAHLHRVLFCKFDQPVGVVEVDFVRRRPERCQLKSEFAGQQARVAHVHLGVIVTPRSVEFVDRERGAELDALFSGDRGKRTFMAGLRRERFGSLRRSDAKGACKAREHLTPSGMSHGHDL